MAKINKVLLGGSFILVATFGIFNILNYLYHFGMLRMLSVAEYGILATLFSIFYITSIFTESIQTILAKYSANQQNEGKLKDLFKRSLKKAVLMASFIFIAYLIISWPLSYLTKINYQLMALTGLIIFALFCASVGRGILQGRKMFAALGMTMIIEGIFKLILGFTFVYIGWKIYGAVMGAVLGVAIAFFYSLFALRHILKSEEQHIPTPAIYQYSWPVFIITLTILIFYSIDILIAKIVFNEETAGLYAIIAVIAKTIFFATQPISRAMFPLTAQNAGKKKKDLFSLSLLILISCVIIALLLFYFFPGLIVRIFAGRYIPEIASLLIYAALGTSILSFTNLVILYRLSQSRINSAFIFVTFIIIEAVLLFFFSGSLFQYVMAFLTANAIFLWGTWMLLKE